MKIITFSDLHLEFGNPIKAPIDSDADVMILAGDIIVGEDIAPLVAFLEGWDRPVFYVQGNHEHYNGKPIRTNEMLFNNYLYKTERKDGIDLLRDSHILMGYEDDYGNLSEEVNFFGGTMWTDFGGSQELMDLAQSRMQDFKLIKYWDKLLTPQDTVEMHNVFKENLIRWFETPMDGPRVVITHHAPVINPRSKHLGTPLTVAFNSLDMLEIIEKYQPDLWIYGHTHECDDQMIGKTRIISNQYGYYPNALVDGFCSQGKPVIIGE